MLKGSKEMEMRAFLFFLLAKNINISQKYHKLPYTIDRFINNGLLFCKNLPKNRKCQ